MTPILSHILALILGFLIATPILWTVNRKQQQDWQAEYRRLMGGIDGARDMVRNQCKPRSLISMRLTDLLMGRE